MAPRRSVKEWFKKYFLEGQALRSTQTEALKNLDPDAPWYKKLLVKHRRWVGVLIPATTIHILWWSCAIRYNIWEFFPDKYFMTLTMILGSIVAGMTSEGGGAVAFPVMTLAFNINPSIARDFSLMIQSTGMSCATFTILWMRITLEWRSIIFCSVGAVLGIVLGLEFVDPELKPAQKKMGFVSIWFAFAFALFLLNRYHKRKTFKIIPEFKPWKACVLVFTGFLGGIFTAVAGSGVDICSFSVLTLLFRVSEKTATPTSVVLMAMNSLVGFYWRGVMMQAIDIEAFRFLAVCAPIVVVGAPTGSMLGSHFHRQVLAAFVYVIDTVSLIGAFAVVKLNSTLIGVSIGIIVFGFIFFGILSFLGHRLMRGITEDAGEIEESASSIDPSVTKTVARNNEAYIASDEKFCEFSRENKIDAKDEKNTRDGVSTNEEMKPNNETSTTYM